MAQQEKSYSEVYQNSSVGEQNSPEVEQHSPVGEQNFSEEEQNYSEREHARLFMTQKNVLKVLMKY